jgi:uncharacterized protein YqfA (UPF0365 family)
MNDRMKDWISLGVLTLQSVGIVWYVSQTVQRLEDHISVLENQQTISRAIEDKLTAAREETNTHFATTDLKITDLSDKMSAILEALQASDPKPDGGTQNAAPPNFPQPQGGGH